MTPDADFFEEAERAIRELSTMTKMLVRECPPSHTASCLDRGLF